MTNDLTVTQDTSISTVIQAAGQRANEAAAGAKARGVTRNEDFVTLENGSLVTSGVTIVTEWSESHLSSLAYTVASRNNL